MQTVYDTKTKQHNIIASTGILLFIHLTVLHFHKAGITSPDIKNTAFGTASVEYLDHPSIYCDVDSTVPYPLLHYITYSAHTSSCEYFICTRLSVQSLAFCDSNDGRPINTKMCWFSVWTTSPMRLFTPSHFVIYIFPLHTWLTLMTLFCVQFNTPTCWQTLQIILTKNKY
jgi:hypothetical protein